MTVITKQSEIAAASTADLVETYNALSGKDPIKKFSSRAAGETQVANAILSAENRAGHKGVAKGEKPDAANGGIKTQVIPEGVSGKKAAAALKRAAKAEKPAPAAKKTAPAKKVAKAEKKEDAAPRGRSATYNAVRLTEPTTTRRPQVDSMRTRVLNALQTLDGKMKSDKVPPAKRIISIDALSEHVGFNARSFVHKLAFQGWCEIAPTAAA